MLVDAMHAITWALVFTGWSSEGGADSCSEYFLDRIQLTDCNFGYIAALFAAVADMIALNMRGGLTFDDACVATRAEAEWLKSVADKALEEHPRKNQQRPRKRPSKSQPGRRSRTPLRRRRPAKKGSAATRKSARTGSHSQGTPRRANSWAPTIRAGKPGTSWHAGSSLKANARRIVLFRKDGVNHFCKRCGKPGHGANTCLSNQADE